MQPISRDLFKGWDVVIIDDDEDSLEVAQIVMQRYGATVHTAINGEEGLKLARSIKPRFIISDISMPVMDGWDLITALQKNLELADIPVVALTAHATMGDRQKAIDHGFHHYLTKPFTIETFISDLVNVLVKIPALKADLVTNNDN